MWYCKSGMLKVAKKVQFNVEAGKENKYYI